ncbi:hypothetical protein CWS43_26805 [Rahnella sp. AA]|uniref:hypothetical protein n=1 Tax=Rahnella sp. AA TaxID=2057180 RepID=UPI000C34B01F|nr:hypothetical protein [Rahnella sp. AA]PKE27457.1 hypothetical protein CWS43_26805 [Rahnella sp. AA]
MKALIVFRSYKNERSFADILAVGVDEQDARRNATLRDAAFENDHTYENMDTREQIPLYKEGFVVDYVPAKSQNFAGLFSEKTIKTDMMDFSFEINNFPEKHAIDNKVYEVCNFVMNFSIMHNGSCFADQRSLGEFISKNIIIDRITALITAFEADKYKQKRVPELTQLLVTRLFPEKTFKTDEITFSCEINELTMHFAITHNESGDSCSGYRDLGESLSKNDIIDRIAVLIADFEADQYKQQKIAELEQLLGYEDNGHQDF